MLVCEMIIEERKAKEYILVVVCVVPKPPLLRGSADILICISEKSGIVMRIS